MDPIRPSPLVVADLTSGLRAWPPSRRSQPNWNQWAEATQDLSVGSRLLK
jgi:hypothetical protein